MQVFLTIHRPEHVPRCDPNQEVQRLRAQVAKFEAENARHRQSGGLSVPSPDFVMDGVSEPASEMQRVRAEIIALRGGQIVTHPIDVQTVSGRMAFSLGGLCLRSAKWIRARHPVVADVDSVAF